MSRHSITSACGLAALIGILLLCAAHASVAGVIRGRVTSLTGTGLANVVVYIDSVAGVPVAAPETHARMDQKNLEFVPHVLPVLSGTTVDFHNSDHVLHNIFTPDSVGDSVYLGSYPKGEVRSHTFLKSCQTACDAVMLCNVHPDMEAYVVVLSNPLFALTDSTGAFVIDNIPQGGYILQTWDAVRQESKTVVTVTDDTLSVGIVLREKP